jgi:hypothetical protein
VPTISLHALQRCRTTVEDFTLSYLPLYGLHPHQGLLRFLDVLVYVSASLYELDEANEALCKQRSSLESGADNTAALVGACRKLCSLQKRPSYAESKRVRSSHGGGQGRPAWAGTS